MGCRWRQAYGGERVSVGVRDKLGQRQDKGEEVKVASGEERKCEEIGPRRQRTARHAHTRQQ
jgi:hypothetical protein